MPTRRIEAGRSHGVMRLTWIELRPLRIDPGLPRFEPELMLFGVRFLGFEERPQCELVRAWREEAWIRRELVW